MPRTKTDRRTDQPRFQGPLLLGAHGNEERVGENHGNEVEIKYAATAMPLTMVRPAESSSRD